MPRKYAPRPKASGPIALATRQRVLDAAEELVATQGVDALDTRLVASLAGVSIGTVYRFWCNKHEILQELHPELADLDAKVRALRKLHRESIPDSDKWARAKEIFSLE